MNLYSYRCLSTLPPGSDDCSISLLQQAVAVQMHQFVFVPIYLALKPSIRYTNGASIRQIATKFVLLKP